MWHTSPTTTPPLHVAVSPGLHVMLHAAQRPIDGALHEAPVSAFFAAAVFFFFSLANAGLDARTAASSTTGSDLVICPLFNCASVALFDTESRQNYPGRWRVGS